MVEGEVYCNGNTRGHGSSSEGLITYRRKRARPSTLVALQEDVSASATASEVSSEPLSKKGRDIGRDCGLQLTGNMLYWQCNQCGSVSSGEFSRLKQHLAGGPDAPRFLKVSTSFATTTEKQLTPAMWEGRDAITSQNPYADKFNNKVPNDTDESNTILHFTNKSNELFSEAGEEAAGKGIDATNFQNPYVNDFGNKGLDDDMNDNNCILRFREKIAKLSEAGKEPVRKNIDVITSQNLFVDDSSDKGLNGMDEINTTLQFRKKNTELFPNAITSQNQYEDDFSDMDLNDMDESNATLQFREKTKKLSVASNKWFIATCQHSKTNQTEAVKEPDLLVQTSFPEDDKLNRLDRHWRNVLERMLQLPDLSEGGGVGSCIRNALLLGPSFARKVRVVDIPEDDTVAKDRYKNICKVQDQSQKPGSSADLTSNPTRSGTYDQAKMNSGTMKCQNVLLRILCSEKFALLCGLICGSFNDERAKSILDLSLINSKMINGDYEQSPELFGKDFLQIWEKFQRIGQDIIRLASDLSNMLLAPNKEQACKVGVEQRNSMDSNTTAQFPSYESERSTKPEQTEPCLYKSCICKQCNCEADLKCSLICDGCEATFHFSCINPAVQRIPTHSWYCDACITNTKGSFEPIVKKKSPEPVLADSQDDRLHQNCVVCEKLKVSESREHPNEISGGTVLANESRECSVSSMDTDGPSEPSRTATLHLCKMCGTCEDDDKPFLECGHTHCLYKYYHIRCLKTSQIASEEQRNRSCWYCPSCLCRGCLFDKDDDKIVLCDGCDEGYHIYCMKPPRTLIPEGTWYCNSCNVARARDGMKRYEQWILENHGKKDARQTNEVTMSNMLLKAVNKLRSEK